MPAKGKRLEIVLDGVHAGQLLQDVHGRLSVVYDDDYRRRSESTPLSLSMPLSRARQEHNTVDPFLRGLLPDSDATPKRWGRRFGVSANSPFACSPTWAKMLLEPHSSSSAHRCSSRPCPTWFLSGWAATREQCGMPTQCWTRQRACGLR